MWLQKQSKRVCCSATGSAPPGLVLAKSLRAGHHHRASSEARPGEAAWMPANLTMGFHLTSTDLSVEIKYETVVASIVCILGVALNKQ